MGNNEQTTTLKGVTFGSDEYIRIAKYVEKRGEVSEALERLDEAVGDIVGLLPEMTRDERIRAGEIIEQLI
ncbi:hypothetical protein [Virgibacillus pantothenticus]|uniref:hypothetical protein n=1 Tax=Virgibacillus pantothenticus TaxID=1473 RepID=UPI000984B022|nr:hypothetical protein [Virgibacillus pantothenticus]